MVSLNWFFLVPITYILVEKILFSYTLLSGGLPYPAYICVQKMSPVHNVCCVYSYALQINFIIEHYEV